MTKPRRRQAGEGTISEYSTKKGSRYLIKYGYVADDGTKKYALKRGFATRRAAAEFLRERTAEVQRGDHVAPNRITVGEFFDTWISGIRSAPSTVESYRKNVRLHIAPHIGSLQLNQVTGTRLTKVYRLLESEGRVDGRGGLAPRTVRYIHTIVHAGFKAAVRDGLISNNPADKADPPSAKSAAAPEMNYWNAEQLRSFLKNSEDHELGFAWRILAMTGLRRGESLGLRWGDIDWDNQSLSMRRSATLTKRKGEGETISVGLPKSGKPRVIDLDPETLAALKRYRASRGTIELSLARDDAYVLGDLDGLVRHPERFSRSLRNAVSRAQRSLPDLPTIRLHDLRHTHATLLLRAGTNVKVVSERLGHASVAITLAVYAHVMPGMQREAAATFASLLSDTNG